MFDYDFEIEQMWTWELSFPSHRLSIEPSERGQDLLEEFLAWWLLQLRFHFRFLLLKANLLLFWILKKRLANWIPLCCNQYYKETQECNDFEWETFWNRRSLAYNRTWKSCVCCHILSPPSNNSHRKKSSRPKSKYLLHFTNH